MRNATLALALLPAILLAQNASPFDGEWKMDTAQSRYTVGKPPISETLNISGNGDQLHVIIDGIGNNGASIATDYTVPIAGGNGQIQKSDQFSSVHSTPFDDHTMEIEFFKDDAELVSERLELQGNNLRASLRGVDSDGNPIEGVQVFEKQTGLTNADPTAPAPAPVANPGSPISDALLKRFWHAQSDVANLKMELQQAQSRLNAVTGEIKKTCGPAGYSIDSSGEPQCAKPASK